MLSDSFIKFLEILGIIAGGVTSVTVLIIGLKKMIAWIVRRHNDVQAI